MISTFKKATPEALAAIREEMAIRKTSEVFLLFAMGSQFDHLIRQTLAKLGVFCLVGDPASVTVKDVEELDPIGIILSGGPSSVHEKPPSFDRNIFDLGIPTLGICLGFQMWASHVGMHVVKAKHREFGTHLFRIRTPNVLFAGMYGTETPVLESHGDRIEIVQDTGAVVLGSTEHAPVAAAVFAHLWGVQFHPEVTESREGPRMFENFCFGICGAKERFPAADAAEQKLQELREQLGDDKKVLLALSGGSDSSVTAHLLGQAITGNRRRIRAVYIRGIDRPDDEAFVRRHFSHWRWLDLRVVDASPRFLYALRGIESMKEKRVAVRGEYKSLLEQEAEAFGAEFIAQGTLYTDISESGGGYASGARKARIKLHHNVNLDFAFPELTPLDDCVKDGARNIGRAIGVADGLLERHPFPGPGLVVRIIGEVTAKRLNIARAADDIFIQELRAADLYRKVWQAGVVVTNTETTCTKGDGDAIGPVLALWAKCSVNGFTATWAELPSDFIRRVSRRLTNEIPAVGRVVYDVSDKPPATIEWG